MSEKVKGMFGHPERAEEVKEWLKSQGAETNIYECNDYMIYFVNNKSVRSMRDEFAYLFDIVELPPKTHNFKPFDKVLVRYGENDRWECNFFSSVFSLTPPRYQCIDATYYQCIPYEGNEHLLGTFKNPN